MEVGGRQNGEEREMGEDAAGFDQGTGRGLELNKGHGKGGQGEEKWRAGKERWREKGEGAIAKLSRVEIGIKE
eukprot:3018604-Pleurochrysis_carterae.AAC.1